MANTDPPLSMYELGRRARRDGCSRIIANATREEREEWLRGFDDQDAAMKGTEEPNT